MSALATGQLTDALDGLRTTVGHDIGGAEFARVLAGLESLSLQHFRRPMPETRTATEIAEAAGIDMSLIRENLALSYEQRVIQHQAALELMLEMERAGQKLRDSTRSADPTTLRR